MRDHIAMAAFLFILTCFLVGFAVGRWWALAAAIAPAVWLANVQEVDAPEWVLPVAYGALAALGICAGVATRRGMSHTRSR
jgi:hypothetical protein